ncbi:hypothetical protein PPACK8108_LOCUS18161 [Phakopsora pachyrhizi]|uniref:Uncharacterized protein n=1 Tax=Phakopsora pachyrhizi TaxID=170000 RepID=A0AAV0BBV7_PHAPC|nr:hypothetical protein PPACK8108_LOCUS18161 [Phakopsora pachyrhizi]
MYTLCIFFYTLPWCFLFLFFSLVLLLVGDFLLYLLFYYYLPLVVDLISTLS